MEWRNDVLSFSGFEYGVSKRNKLGEEDHDVCEPGLDDIAIGLREELNKDESKCNSHKNGGEAEGQFDNNDPQTNKCEFDPMDERKIENFYFRNVEQAEKKMKQLTNLKSKWSEPWQPGDQLVAKVCLKPKNHANPWKDKTIQEKEIAEQLKNHRKRATCVIS